MSTHADARFDPFATLIHLREDGRALPVEWTPEVFRRLATGDRDRVVGAKHGAEPADFHADEWEMHPAGDELLYLLTARSTPSWTSRVANGSSRSAGTGVPRPAGGVASADPAPAERPPVHHSRPRHAAPARERPVSEGFLLLALLTDATMRGAAPLVLAALGGLFAERSGVVDIGLEGKMLAAAFAAAATAAVTGSAWAGLAAGIAASVALALVHGLACVTYQGNQVVSGMALNILVSGLTVVLGYAWFQEGGQTPLLSGAARFAPIDLPGAAALAGVPGLGLLYGEVLSGHNVLVYMAGAAVPAVAWLVYRTRFGLRLRAVGDSPGAVDTAGISVAATRYRALAVGGILCGLSGAYLSIAHHSSFIRDMSAGKGYLALAALIFGQWRPVPTLGACLLFAFADVIQVRLQGTPLPVVGVVPVQLIQAIPYVLTVGLLAGFVGRAVAPRAIGVPYVKER